MVKRKNEAEMGEELPLPPVAKEIRAEMPVDNYPNEVIEKPSVGSKAEAMKKALDAQPKVSIIVPLEKGEIQGSTLAVTLNGYRLNIRKGMYVQVPQQVADIVMESQHQTAEAINNHFHMNAG